MGIILAGIVSGSLLFWVLVSSAFCAAGAFIFSIIRNRRAEEQLREPLPEAQRKALYSAVQLDALRQMLADTGYAYDWKHNIFYSVMNPWQRKFGYCSLYDESSAPFGMVIDCEPVYFEYDGKRWMIELWKGQYGITTGAEIGVYNTTGPDLNIPGVFNGTFYNCANDEDTLSMTYTLLKGNTTMFNRAAKHWWLTGFRLGEFSKPSDLTLEASITFKSPAMQKAFLDGLQRIGYKSNEIRYSGNTVLILFTKPHSKQPLTRKGLISWLALRNNKRMVAKYRRLTKGYDNMYDILVMLKEKSPILYSLAMKMGKQQELFKQHETIKQYLSDD